MASNGRKQTVGAVWSEDCDDLYSIRQRATVSSNPTKAAGPHGRDVWSSDGTDDKAAFGNVYGAVKSFEGWVYLATTTEQIIDFDGGSHYIHASSGTLTATGWSSPTIYVNGVATTTITATAWHHIAVTTATAFAASNLQLATDNTDFGQVRLADLSMWARALSADEVSDAANWTLFSHDLERNHLWDMSTINPVDHVGSSDGTGTGLVAADDIVAGPFDGLKGTRYNGTDEKTDFGDVGTIRSISFWVRPDTTTEELLLLDTGVDIMVSAGTITYTGCTGSATYVNGTATTTLAANEWQHVVCVLNADTDCNNFEAANDGTNYGAITIAELATYSTALTNIQAADLYARRSA